MLRRAVVGNDVEQDAQAQRMGVAQQLIELFHGAEEGIDAAVVTDVVALVHLGRRLERGQPDPVHTE